MDFTYDGIVSTIWEDIKGKYKISGGKPVAIFMMGVPASGKATSINFLLSKLQHHSIGEAQGSRFTEDMFVHIDPDIFMEYIPTYDASNASDFNKHGVIISSKIMTKVLEEKYFFIYYGTGKNYKSYTTMINKAIKNNYFTILVHIDVELEIAMRRALQRSRYIDPDIINSIYLALHTENIVGRGNNKKSKTNLEILSEKVHLTYIINNNGPVPVIADIIDNTVQLGSGKIKNKIILN